MSDKQAVSTIDTNQVGTHDLAGQPAGPTAQATSAPLLADPSQAPEGPAAAVVLPGSENALAQEAGAEGTTAPGAEVEQVVWEARYSMKNFIGRLTARTILTLAWIAMAIYTWGGSVPRENVRPLTIVLGFVLAFLWLGIGYRILKARYGHYYRLTNRRLFVSTGLMRRRRDQMELLRVKDVFTRQTLIERSLSLGTVVVVSTESQLPTFYLAGVDDPKRVMDLVWRCARAEREGKTVQVENL